MTIRKRFLLTVMLLVFVVCLFGATFVSAEQNSTIATRLTLSGFSSSARARFAARAAFAAAIAASCFFAQEKTIHSHFDYA